MKGKKKTIDNNECFVIMPISDPKGYSKGHFKKVYEAIIKPACEKAGFLPILGADEIAAAGDITATLLQKLSTEAMVICDTSSATPNVMYQLGIRHALQLPVLMIQDKSTPPIFGSALSKIVQYDKALKNDAVAKSIDVIASAIAQLTNGPSITLSKQKNKKEPITRKTYNMKEAKDTANLVAEDFTPLAKVPIARITMNPAICQGRPTIRNTRYTVDLLLDLLSAGMTTTEILDDYPALEAADIEACLKYAAQLSKVKSVNRILA